MADKKAVPQWMGKPIVNESHHGDLEQRSAIHEFSNKMPRADAEARAYEEYVTDHRQRAMAHHLDGLRAAEAVGDKESAFRSWLLYDMHAKALGLDSVGPVAPEVQKHVDAEDKKSRVKFKAHPADIFALQDHKEKESGQESGHDGPEAKKSEVELELEAIEDLSKSASEGHVCQWRLGERKCKNPGSRTVGGKRFCHHHENHWANRITQKEEKLSKPDIGINVDSLGKGDLIEGKFPPKKAAPKIPGRGPKATVIPIRPPAAPGAFLPGFEPLPPTQKSEVELELESIENLKKGDVIPFPKDRVPPAQDLGQPASVIEHPVEAISRDLRENGVMPTPKLTQRILNDQKDVKQIGQGLLNAGHPPANVAKAQQMVMELRRKAALQGKPVDPRSKAPIQAKPAMREIRPANPERIRPPLNSKSGRFPDAKVIPIKPPEKK